MLRNLWVAVVLPFALGISFADAQQTPVKASSSVQADSSSANKEKFRLVAVRVKGLHEFTEDEVVAATGLKIGSPVVPGNFQSAADKLVATGAFTEVTFSYTGEKGGYVLEFQLQEADKYQPVLFENFVWVSSDELIAYLKDRVPLFHGRTTESGQMIRGILDALTLWLGEHKINGQAAFRPEAEMNGPIKAIAFYVDGLRMPVTTVTLENAAHLTDKERERLIKTLVGNDYEKSVAEAAISQSMETMYQRKGYLKARASAPTLKILSNTPDQVEIGLTYTIEEGKQYTLKSLQWTGNTSLPSSELQKAVKVTPGAVANLVVLKENLYSAQKMYGVLGMLRAHIEPKLTYDDPAGTVSALLEVNEGPVFTMGSVEFEGLNSKEVDQLRAKWALKFGQRYNSDYATQFLRNNVAITLGRVAKVQQTIAPGNVVHLKFVF